MEMEEEEEEEEEEDEKKKRKQIGRRSFVRLRLKTLAAKALP